MSDDTNKDNVVNFEKPKRPLRLTSKLLISESPLQVLPSLAAKIGLNEALMLQQIHYWISNELNQNIKNDRIWVYNTYSEWLKQFPFWSYRTIERTILSLESKKLITSGTFNKLSRDRTKWYTINYDELECLEIGTFRQNGVMQSAKMADPNPPNRHNALPEITTETSPDINKKNNKKSFEKEFEEFWNLSPNIRKKRKGSAFERFNKLLNEDYSYFEKIMSAWKKQIDEWEAAQTPMMYRTSPTYWLRDEGFNDEYLTGDQIREECSKNRSTGNGRYRQNGHGSNAGRPQSKREAGNSVIRAQAAEDIERARRAFLGIGEREVGSLAGPEAIGS